MLETSAQISDAWTLDLDEHFGVVEPVRNWLTKILSDFHQVPILARISGARFSMVFRWRRFVALGFCWGDGSFFYSPEE